MAYIDPRLLPELEPKPGWRGRFFHSDHMTFAYYEIERGAMLPSHEHENEEVWHVIEGVVELTVGAHTQCVSAGQAAIVPADTAHSATVKERARTIVVDYPVRTQLGGIKL